MDTERLIAELHLLRSEAEEARQQLRDTIDWHQRIAEEVCRTLMYLSDTRAAVVKYTQRD